MKRPIALFLLLGLLGTVAAQPFSLRGESYLPDSGDYALGLDAMPVLAYVGNMFNGTEDNEPPFVAFPNNSFALQGKVFVKKYLAYRARVRLGVGSASTISLVPDATDADEEVEDRRTVSGTNVLLNVGLEQRKGKTRVQGFYGVEVQVGANNGRTTYTYGNAIDDAEDFSRLLEETNGLTLSLGGRGFAGAEVFIFPKLALGFEYGFGLIYALTGAQKTTVETWDGTDIEIVESRTGRSNRFGIDNDNNGGILTLTFVF
ncbi:MAG: hypothetical protein OHK0039_20760 [Bacteroidia bacterium]